MEAAARPAHRGERRDQAAATNLRDISDAGTNGATSTTRGRDDRACTPHTQLRVRTETREHATSTEGRGNKRAGEQKGRGSPFPQPPPSGPDPAFPRFP